MLKKTLAAVGLAGALILGSAASALAATYPVDVEVTVSSATVTVGDTTAITVTGLGSLPSVTFTHNAPTGTIASIVAAAASGKSVVKPVSGGQATAYFTTSAPGTHTIEVWNGSERLGAVQVTVVASGSGSADSSLPPTGGSVPAAVIWMGVGLVGVGGIAVAAVAAHRRTRKN